MKNIDTKLKNVTQDNFSQFLSNFNTIKKAEKGFYFWDGRKVDHAFLKGVAQERGVKEMPSEQELDKLI